MQKINGPAEIQAAEKKRLISNCGLHGRRFGFTNTTNN